jgi:ferritin
MIGQKIQDALNEQIKHEIQSAYIYLSMAAYCEAQNLPGFAKWMRVQHQEETGHGLKIFDHILDRAGKVTLQAIEQPPSDFKSPLEMMQTALGHERKVTGLINRLYDLAVEEEDRPARVMLEWFVSEQVEEEKQVSAIVEQLKLIGDSGVGLLMLDRELGGRQAA